MKKLKLEMDDLKVESFRTAADEAEEGTVVGQETWIQCSVNNRTCNGRQTCDGGYTCRREDTCQFDSCDGACGSYFCDPSADPADSCLNPSCVYTCAVNC